MKRSLTEVSMTIDIAALTNSLRSFILRNKMKNDEKLTISTISFFDRKNLPHEGEVLYIGYAADLPEMMNAGQPLNLICIENTKIPDYYAENPDINMIILESGAELMEIYNAVNALLSNERQLNHAMARMFQSIINGSGIQEICKIGYELLGNPVAIQDNSMKHIAYAPSYDVDDAVWMEFIKNDGYVSNDTLLLFTTQIEFKQDFNHPTPYIMSKGKFKYRRMVSHIFANQKVVGTMVVIESERPFSEIDLQVIAMITKVLSLEMIKSSFIVYSKGLAYEHFLKDLLDGMHDEALINEKLKTQNLQIKEDLYVLTIDISAFDKTYKTLQYFRDSMDHLLYDCKSIIFNDYIVIIVMRNGGRTLTETELQKMNDFFEKNNLYGGISNCFHHIKDVKDYFNQAVAAAVLSRRMNKGHRLSYYRDYVVYHLVETASKKIDIHQFCFEPLLKLIEYDRQNNTPYAQNLYEYLVHERNLAHTTVALHTHRNTLIYRLKKIEEILQVDLEDREVRLQLLITYKILELL